MVFLNFFILMIIMVIYSDVLAAYQRLSGNVNRTPVMQSRTLNRCLNAEVFLKCENFQRIGAFKFRGAFNALSLLPEDQKKKGVITHSSGNHAQAIALASQLLGIKAVIVMPKNSPAVKVNATKGYGAEVILCENTVESRQATTDALIAQFGYTLVHPYDNDNVIAGAGTAAYELLQDLPDLDLIIAPVGGGGFLSGTCIASKGFNPKIQIYAAEPFLADDAYQSLQAGTIRKNIGPPKTIADGLLTNLCDRTFKIIRENVNRIVRVTDEQIIDAMQFLWERMKIVVEPSGAVSLAALLSGEIDVIGKKVGVMISGGNLDLNAFFTQIRQVVHEREKLK
jgi:threonine dehydratase